MLSESPERANNSLQLRQEEMLLMQINAIKHEATACPFLTSWALCQLESAGWLSPTFE